MSDMFLFNRSSCESDEMFKEVVHMLLSFEHEGNKYAQVCVRGRRETMTGWWCGERGRERERTESRE